MNNQEIEKITFKCIKTETEHKLLNKDILNKEYNKILLENGIRRF